MAEMELDLVDVHGQPIEDGHTEHHFCALSERLQRLEKTPFQVVRGGAAEQHLAAAMRGSEALVYSVYQLHQKNKEHDSLGVDRLSVTLEVVLQQLQKCVGLPGLHVKQLALALMANHLLALVATAQNRVSEENHAKLLKLVKTARKGAVCRRAGTSPAQSLNFLAIQLTQLECGLLSLHTKEESSKTKGAAVRLAFGIAKSALSMTLNSDVLEAGADLVKLGAQAARRHYARPAYQQLFMVGSEAVLHKREKHDKHFETLLKLRKHHFSSDVRSSWELKAAVAYAIGDVIVGASDSRGAARLHPKLLAELCTGKHGLCALLAEGDKLGETRDRAHTSRANLYQLGSALFNDTGSLDMAEWSRSLCEVVVEPARHAELIWVELCGQIGMLGADIPSKPDVNAIDDALKTLKQDSALLKERFRHLLDCLQDGLQVADMALLLLKALYSNLGSSVRQFFTVALHHAVNRLDEPARKQERQDFSELAKLVKHVSLLYHNQKEDAPASVEKDLFKLRHDLASFLLDQSDKAQIPPDLHSQIEKIKNHFSQKDPDQEVFSWMRGLYAQLQSLRDRMEKVIGAAKEVNEQLDEQVTQPLQEVAKASDADSGFLRKAVKLVFSSPRKTKEVKQKDLDWYDKISTFTMAAVDTASHIEKGTSEIELSNAKGKQDTAYGIAYAAMLRLAVEVGSLKEAAQENLVDIMIEIQLEPPDNPLKNAIAMKDMITESDFYDEVRQRLTSFLKGDIFDQTLKQLQQIAEADPPIDASMLEALEEDVLPWASQALAGPVCELIKDVGKDQIKQRRLKADQWRVREVAALSSLRVLEELDRSMSMLAEAKDDIIIEPKRESEGAESEKGHSAPDASEQWRALSDVRDRLMQEVMKRRAYERTAVRSLLINGHELAAQLNRLTFLEVSAEAARVDEPVLMMEKSLSVFQDSLLEKISEMLEGKSLNNTIRTSANDDLDERSCSTLHVGEEESEAVNNSDQEPGDDEANEQDEGALGSPPGSPPASAPASPPGSPLISPPASPPGSPPPPGYKIPPRLPKERADHPINTGHARSPPLDRRSAIDDKRMIDFNTQAEVYAHEPWLAGRKRAFRSYDSIEKDYISRTEKEHHSRGSTSRELAKRGYDGRMRQQYEAVKVTAQMAGMPLSAIRKQAARTQHAIEQHEDRLADIIQSNHEELSNVILNMLEAHLNEQKAAVTQIWGSAEEKLQAEKKTQEVNRSIAAERFHLQRRAWEMVQEGMVAEVKGLLDETNKELKNIVERGLTNDTVEGIQALIRNRDKRAALLKVAKQMEGIASEMSSEILASVVQLSEVAAASKKESQDLLNDVCKQFAHFDERLRAFIEELQMLLARCDAGNPPTHKQMVHILRDSKRYIRLHPHPYDGKNVQPALRNLLLLLKQERSNFTWSIPSPHPEKPPQPTPHTTEELAEHMLHSTLINSELLLVEEEAASMGRHASQLVVGTLVLQNELQVMEARSITAELPTNDPLPLPIDPQPLPNHAEQELERARLEGGIEIALMQKELRQTERHAEAIMKRDPGVVTTVNHSHNEPDVAASVMRRELRCVEVEMHAKLRESEREPDVAASVMSHELRCVEVEMHAKLRESERLREEVQQRLEDALKKLNANKPFPREDNHISDRLQEMLLMQREVLAQVESRPILSSIPQKERVPSKATPLPEEVNPIAEESGKRVKHLLFELQMMQQELLPLVEKVDAPSWMQSREELSDEIARLKWELQHCRKELRVVEAETQQAKSEGDARVRALNKELLETDAILELQRAELRQLHVTSRIAMNELYVLETDLRQAKVEAAAQVSVLSKEVGTADRALWLAQLDMRRLQISLTLAIAELRNTESEMKWLIIHIQVISAALQGEENNCSRLRAELLCAMKEIEQLDVESAAFALTAARIPSFAAQLWQSTIREKKKEVRIHELEVFVRIVQEELMALEGEWVIVSHELSASQKECSDLRILLELHVLLMRRELENTENSLTSMEQGNQQLKKTGHDQTERIDDLNKELARAAKELARLAAELRDVKMTWVPRFSQGKVQDHSKNWNDLIKLLECVVEEVKTANDKVSACHTQVLHRTDKLTSWLRSLQSAAEKYSKHIERTKEAFGSTKAKRGSACVAPQMTDRLEVGARSPPGQLSVEGEHRQGFFSGLFGCCGTGSAVAPGNDFPLQPDFEKLDQELSSVDAYSNLDAPMKECVEANHQMHEGVNELRKMINLLKLCFLKSEEALKEANALMDVDTRAHKRLDLCQRGESKLKVNLKLVLDELKRCELKVIDSDSRAAQAENSLIAAENSRNTVQAKLDESNRKNEQLNRTVDSLKKEADMSTATGRELRKKLQDAETSRDALDRNLKRLTKEYGVLQRKAAAADLRARTDIVVAEKEIRSMDELLGKLHKEFTLTSRRFEQARLDADLAKVAQKSNAIEIVELQNSVQLLKRELIKVEHESSVLWVKQDRQGNDCNRLRVECKVFQKECRFLESCENQLQGTVDELNRAGARQMKDLGVLNRELRSVDIAKFSLFPSTFAISTQTDNAPGWRDLRKKLSEVQEATQTTLSAMTANLSTAEAEAQTAKADLEEAKKQLKQPHKRGFPFMGYGGVSSQKLQAHEDRLVHANTAVVAAETAVHEATQKTTDGAVTVQRTVLELRQMIEALLLAASAHGNASKRGDGGDPESEHTVPEELESMMHERLQKLKEAHIKLTESTAELSAHTAQFNDLLAAAIPWPAA